MKELSVFIDESGDFGEVKERPAYYLVTFVFHNQANNINQQVTKLEETLNRKFYDREILDCICSSFDSIKDVYFMIKEATA